MTSTLTMPASAVDSLNFSGLCSIERQEERDLRALLQLTLPLASTSKLPTGPDDAGRSSVSTAAPGLVPMLSKTYRPFFLKCQNVSYAPPPSPSSPQAKPLPFSDPNSSSSLSSSPISLAATTGHPLPPFGLGLSQQVWPSSLAASPMTT